MPLKSSERIFTWSQTDTRKYDILDTLKFAVGDEGILLQSRSALNGKKIYMLHQQAQPVPTQQTLNFDENTE